MDICSVYFGAWRLQNIVVCIDPERGWTDFGRSSATLTTIEKKTLRRLDAISFQSIELFSIWKTLWLCLQQNVLWAKWRAHQFREFNHEKNNIRKTAPKP
jgi:hypothetical protein